MLHLFISPPNRNSKLSSSVIFIYSINNKVKFFSAVQKNEKKFTLVQLFFWKTQLSLITIFLRCHLLYMGYIKSVIVFAVLRRSMQAVCEAQLRVIALRQTQFLTKKCRSGGKPSLNAVSDLTCPRFELQTSLSKQYVHFTGRKARRIYLK